jgi:hypothetical protein
MTAEERVHALMEFRFTERQARFLALGCGTPTCASHASTRASPASPRR